MDEIQRCEVTFNRKINQNRYYNEKYNFCKLYIVFFYDLLIPFNPFMKKKVLIFPFLLIAHCTKNCDKSLNFHLWRKKNANKVNKVNKFHYICMAGSFKNAQKYHKQDGLLIITYYITIL